MTPAELYARQPEKIDRDLDVLTGFNFNHLKELESLTLYEVELNKDKNTRITKDFNFDGRRCWRLASIWFDDAVEEISLEDKKGLVKLLPRRFCARVVCDALRAGFSVNCPNMQRDEPIEINPLEIEIVVWRLLYRIGDQRSSVIVMHQNLGYCILYIWMEDFEN